jgi:N-acetylneuraminic acid mutarotase
LKIIFRVVFLVFGFSCFEIKVFEKESRYYQLQRRTAMPRKQMRHYFRLSLLLSLLSLFMSCGGGGGGSGNTGGSTYSLSGTVTASGGGALSGVEVTLSGAGSDTEFTDANGAYTFTNLPNGDYTLTPALAGYTLAPASRLVTVSGADQASMDFVGTINPTNVWTWVSGGSTINQKGVYGTKGAPGSGKIPGGRYGCNMWRDGSGNLWLFGGYGYDSDESRGGLNDLWTFDMTTRQWTWVSGSDSRFGAGVYGTRGTPAAANVPGARYGSVSWTDSDGNFWLFGGNGFTVGECSLNDLWKFDMASRQWTWVSGSSVQNQAGVYGTQGTPSTANIPGARAGSVGWADNAGNLWLFGGTGYDSNGLNDDLNDLWKFDIDTLEWTWVSGAKVTRQAGTYGTRGVPDAANIPGAREGSVSWTDSDGNFWLFGGMGYDAASHGFVSQLNDLWKFDKTTLEWTWVSGADVVRQAGNYGNKGVPSATNVPGAREASLSWTGIDGNFWLFGGKDQDGFYQNDLWKFDLGTSEWTWVSGDSTPQQSSVYGTKGAAAAANKPGSREHITGWTDSSGNLWLFGGYGYDSPGVNGYFNDLWKYEP